MKNGTGGTVKNGNMSNQELAEELHKPIIWKLKKQKVRLWHEVCDCTRTPLHTPKTLRKSTSCLIKKASRCAADRTSKTTTFFIFHFLGNTKILWENCVCLLFIGSVVKTILYLHFLYTEDNRLPQIKKKHKWWHNRFSDVFTYPFNLWHFASLFFLTKDNFMF